MLFPSLGLPTTQAGLRFRLDNADARPTTGGVFLWVGHFSVAQCG